MLGSLFQYKAPNCERSHINAPFPSETEQFYITQTTIEKQI